MKWLGIILLAVVYHLSLSFAAKGVEPIVLSQGYWVDQGATATLAEARQRQFQPFEGSVAEGYSTAALWLKIRVAGRTDGEPLAVVVKPAFLRRVELHDPERNGWTAEPIVSGRDAAITQANHIGLDNGFRIASTPSSREIFLRIVTTTSLTAEVHVVPFESANRSSHVFGGALAIYFGFLLCFCIWGLVNWGVRRDSLYGLFALRQFYSMGHIFVFFGTLRFFLANELSADLREFIYTFVTCSVVIAVGYFDMRLISEIGGARPLRIVTRILVFSPLGSVLLVILGQSQDALQWATMNTNLMMISMVLFAFSARSHDDLPYGRMLLWLVRLGFVAMAAIIVVPILMYQNFLRSNVPLFGILFFHAFISSIILYSILTVRSRQRDLVAQQTRLVAQVREAELQRERGRRAEKERFLSMLTHELRNPLSVIRLLVGSGEQGAATVQKAAQDMAQVIERVEQSEKLDDGQAFVETTRFDIADLVARIAAEHPASARLRLELEAPRFIVSDPTLLQRIVENLLDNAAKYSPPASPIGVILRQEGAGERSGVCLTVVNGFGTAGAPDPERLFTKYYRSKQAHRQPGSGLGLFLVASWAEALGGRISYAASGSPPDQARFSLWVPL